MNREKLYLALSKIVKEYCGISYNEKTYFQLDARIESLKKSLACATDNDLLQLVSRSMTAEQHMMVIDIATNNETYFFRDIKMYQALEKVIFPEMIAQKKQVIDIWSLASSTGQEAYSILMTWEKVAKKDGSRVTLHASDISKRVLLRVASGTYTHLEVQRGLPIMDLTKYFKPAPENQWQVTEELRRKVTTSEFNLISSHFVKEKYDLIFCRNVLIYQEVEKRKEIVNSIYSSLKPGGYFIMGNAENLIGVSDKFQSTAQDGCTFYRKPLASQKAAA